MNAINLFNKWVDLGKDDGMVTNHRPSVDYMISLIPKTLISQKFSFIDIGCGNGWVVQNIRNKKNCIKSVGIDGAEKMIQKAMEKDPNSEYFQFDIEKMDYKGEFNIVFSMEVFYYFSDPLKVLNYIYKNILKSGGCMIMGVDHYLENTSSLSWGKDLGLELKTLSIDEWEATFKQVGFKNIKLNQFGAKENWSGTLVIYSEKKD